MIHGQGDQGSRFGPTGDFVKAQRASYPHAPGPFRGIGRLANLPAFAKAFSCKTGDPVVRSDADRVVIW